MMYEYEQVKRDQKLEADVVVVGSGAGGAAMAQRLAEMGKKVILIEEGRHVPPEKFTTDSWAAMRQLYRDDGMRAMIGTTVIPTLQAKCVGGTTVVNSAICFRLPDDVLDEWVEKEKLTDLTPEIVRPHFEAVEKMTNISPEPENVLGRNNLLMRRACEALGWKNQAIQRNSRNCKGCGVCMSGCVEGAKMSTDLNYVPSMLELGGGLYTDCRVEQVIVENGRARGVRGVFIDPSTGKPTHKLEVRAEAVVLACGAMGTPVLLLKNGLANSSGMVGRNLVNHTATGMLGFLDEEVRGWDGVNQGWCCDEFREQGFIIEVVWCPPDVIVVRLPGFGLSHKNMMAKLGHAIFWGAMIRAESTGRVIASKKSWSPTIFYSMNKRDAKLMQKAMKATADLMFAGGARSVLSGIYGLPKEFTDPSQTELISKARIKASDFVFIGNHPAGTCRMSEAPGKGVVDSHGQSHDVKNLFIADASVFPNAPGVNPQVTIMALASHFAGFVAGAV